MKTLIRLALLVVGFLGGVAFSVRFPQLAVNVDRVRAEEQAKLQAKIQPQIDAAVSKAKIDVLNRVLSDAPTASTGGRPGFVGSGFVSGNVGAPAAGDKRTQFQRELEQEQQKLQQAEKQLDGPK
jgi:hypothetical protein